VRDVFADVGEGGRGAGPPVYFDPVKCCGCGNPRGINAEKAEKSRGGRSSELVILQKPVTGLSKAGLERFLLCARRAAGLKGTVNLLVTSSAEVRSLNRQFRGKNKETDVLSFPANSQRTIPMTARGALRLAGEIAISAEVAKQSAALRGHSAADEVKILALHGILHLAGFDHERDNGQMERRERRLRTALRLPAGLIERNTSGSNTGSDTGLKTRLPRRASSSTQRAKARRKS
jgi:probable rRNA maturation factor